jgi:putative transposase
MSWKDWNIKQEKLKFIGDWLKEEYSFKDLCQRYKVSRKTGYKLISRYEAEGEYALEERSHARHSHPNETPREIKARLVALKQRYPKWGPSKLRDWLLLNDTGIWPAASTIGGILKKHGLVEPRRYRKRMPGYGQPFMILKGSLDWGIRSIAIR